MILKYATVKLAEFKAKTSGNGGFEGYGSVFGVRDDGGDTVLKGAYASGIDSFKQRGFIGLGHDWTGLPIGYVADAKEDDIGLQIATEYHSTAQAQDARKVAQERMEAGKGVYLSIGYSVEPGGSYYSEDGATRFLTNLKLYEVSQVNVPMLSVAEVTGVKAVDQGDRVLVAIKDYAERLQAIDTLRRKDGRTLSEANRNNLAEVLAELKGVTSEIETLINATSPLTDGSKGNARLFAEFQAIAARMNGVAVA